MLNFVQPGKNLTLPAAPRDLDPGDGVLVGSIFGVASNAAASGAEVVVVTEGVFTLPKTSALAISVGDLLYWDDAGHVVNKTAAGQPLVGVAVGAAVNPSPTVPVRLNGSFAVTNPGT
jgi:predicted RecA/RadA family phage recombinase